MADQKLTALTEDTTPSSSDLAYTVKDPAGTPLSRKATWLNIVKGALSGIWTPASSSGPASFAFHEDTDNGTNKATVIAPASMAADRTLTLPDETGTLVSTGSLGVYAAFTPTFSQSATLTTSSLTSRWMQIGKFVHFYGVATFSSAGTSGTGIGLTLPVACASGHSAGPLGSGAVLDNGTAYYHALAYNDGPGIIFQNTDGTNGQARIGAANGPQFAIASGDQIWWNVTYETT